jgi:exo-beta-1,3-glucanase (GH17 family)
MLLCCAACSPYVERADEPASLGVAFQPRGFREFPTLHYPSREEVARDLRMLASAGFRSLVTYGAADVLGAVPELAREAGFDGRIVMGIWDPFSDEELSNALAQAGYVDAYCVGNEGLGIRYEPDELHAVMAHVRRATGKPVTTSEPIDRYLQGPYRDWLHDHSDWLFPNAHPYLAGRHDPDEAAAWTVARYDYLVASAAGKDVVLKEAGYPTHRDDCCDEGAQRAFFTALMQSGIRFLLFEAFDQPGKLDSATEPRLEHHWGLFRADGTPKAVVSRLLHGGGP